MSISNTTIEKRIRLRKKLGLNDIKTISNNNLSSKVIFTKTSRSRNLNTELSRVILKGKLFGLINKSNIMTEEQFHDIKIKLSLSKLEKYKESKKKNKREFLLCPKKSKHFNNFKKSKKI
jgi:hypothetical protein